MKHNQFLILVAICICFVTKSFSQKGNYRIQNGLLLEGGITKLDILTDNFITKEGDGFYGGTAATVNIPLKWYDISFGMKIAENNISISGRPTQSSAINEFIDYKLFTVQLPLIIHTKIIEHYITVDAGPMFQYNSKLEINDKSYEDFYINNYSNITAADIYNISQINLNGLIGITLGIKNFKLRAQYVYGFTNIFNKLEKQNLETSGGDSRFKGNQSQIFLGAAIMF
ncbi:hypothetical protein [Neotamlana laminarinivorans]|uniref:Outer membrane protein beta-barrel domain-containing protein n=1 Tax=Neotamlana laminarinivorans TaxID=2883124 RepID=A0A9X1HZ75_9FLAO|nr:hypothetical protein [Tamlana laminarinivorans]MCB4798291.1 hypothetical protein [Tamlana laminarinivorans]